MFSIAVPTSSIIAIHKDDPYKVYVIEQSEKHRGRLTLVGGKLEMPRQNHLQCALEEWNQEAGGVGAKLFDTALWAIKTDEYSDVRQSTLGRLTADTCPEDLRAVPAIGHYGAPDYIYLAKVDGTPYPSDGEAKQCLSIDVRDIELTATENESRFGAQHDLILLVYRLSLAGRPVSNQDFTDFDKLRRDLPQLLSRYES